MSDNLAIRIRRTLLLISLLSGTAYVMGDIAMGVFPLAFLLKALPIWILAGMVFRGAIRMRDRGAWIVAVGLLFGSGGDIFLIFGMFVPGLVAFLLGHLCYMGAWALEFRFDRMRGIIALGLLGIAIEIAAWLSPVLPAELVVPVYAYVCIIALMAGLAFLRKRRQLLVPLGAVLFLLSDTIIAVNRFQAPIPLSGLWIMLTYYVAQSMIALGYLRERR